MTQKKAATRPGDEPPFTKEAIENWRALPPDEQWKLYPHLKARLRRAVDAARLGPCGPERKED